VPLLADITLSIYFGVSHTHASDLRVTQQARGNDATLHDVAWRDYPGRAPIYYGVRLTYSPPNHPWTRIAIDYTHLKIYAQTAEVVRQEGTWHGAPFSQLAPMQQRVQSFEITHGLNLLGIALLQNVSGPSQSGAYIGGGPVIYLPHSENRVDGVAGGDGYEYGGGGFEAVAGIRGCMGAEPLFAEAKFSHGTPYVSIAQGRARTRVDAVHVVAGIDVRRCTH
jgi:hypothetical protein